MASRNSADLSVGPHPRSIVKTVKPRIISILSENMARIFILEENTIVTKKIQIRRRTSVWIVKKEQ